MVFVALLTALFASIATADLTTSVWLPGAANANQTLKGSVVEQNGDMTVLSLAFASTPTTPDLYTSAPARVTVAGTTRVVYAASASDAAASGSTPSVTVQVDCVRPTGDISAVPTCTVSTQGANQALSAVCAGLTVSPVPDYCTNADAQTFEQTLTFSGDSQFYLNNYQLIITAGEEKLGSAAAATPTANGA